MPTKSGLALAGLAVTLFAAPASVEDEKWPTEPLRIMAGFPAGGHVDPTIRALSGALEQEIGVPIKVIPTEDAGRFHINGKERSG